MPFRPPARVVVERDVIERTIAEIDNCREQVKRAIDLMESGRTGKAKDALAELLVRLS
jgi:hypothetical protein